MLRKLEGELREHHAGELRREGAELRAERIIAEERSGQGWTEAELGQRRKSDPQKPAFAARLRWAFAAPKRLRPRRRQTTLTVGWIARRLTLGTRKRAAAKLHRWTQRTQERRGGHANTMV